MGQVSGVRSEAAPRCFFDESVIPAVVAAPAVGLLPVVNGFLLNSITLRWCNTRCDPHRLRFQSAASFGKAAKLSIAANIFCIGVGGVATVILLYEGITKSHHRKREVTAPRLGAGLYGSIIAGAALLVDRKLIPDSLYGRRAYPPLFVAAAGLLLSVGVASYVYRDLKAKTTHTA